MFGNFNYHSNKMKKTKPVQCRKSDRKVVEIGKK